MRGFGPENLAIVYRREANLDIAAGLSGLKAAAEMTKMLRDGLKGGRIPADEIAGRIGEIYDYIIDSKAALVDAREEIAGLRAELRRLQSDAGVFLEGGVNWEKKDDHHDGPLCPTCWGLNHHRHPMILDHKRNHPEYVVYDCCQHQAMVSLRVPKSVLQKYLPGN